MNTGWAGHHTREQTDNSEFGTSVTLRESCRHQNAPSQQVEAGPAIALPFQQLDAVDLAFSLSAAPGFGECGAHRGGV